MHWLKCSLLTTILWVTYWQDSAAQHEFPNKAAEAPDGIEPKENEIDFSLSDSAETVATEKIISNFTTNLTHAENLISEPNGGNTTSYSSGVQISFKSDKKRDDKNVTFNDVKPFLLFPILPFLFPPKEDEGLNSDKNKTSKEDGNPAKPFIFFDFSFIRRIPLNNSTKSSNNSKIINVEKLRVGESDDLKNSQKNRKRRNTKADGHGFFDPSPLFPDFGLEEFLPRSDLLFPDLPFQQRSLKKLSRRKRDKKKPDFKNDLKIFFDAFDDAFMRTKRELERVDPILNFLRGNEQSFDEDKKVEDGFFNRPSSVQEKPRMKWKIQRNIQRVNNNNNQDRLTTGPDGPMILVDKVVKIGEFHMYDEGDDKGKSKKKKKREMNDPKKNNLKRDNHDETTLIENDETFPKNIFELIKQEENKRKKRNHSVQFQRPSQVKIQSGEIKVMPRINASLLSVGTNSTIEINKKDSEVGPQRVNATEKAVKYGNFMKVIDSLKIKIKEEMTDSGERLKRDPNYYEKLNSKKASYDDLKKNVRELLSQFLELAKNSDDAKLVERLEVGERNNAGVFDWTEKETLQSTNMLEKFSREKRQKKDTDFEDEYADMGKKERQIADLNYLFLTVTLPTVFIFALALLVCFFSLQVKGKICSKLFRPRQIFTAENKNPAQFKCTTGIKTRSKGQAI